jgi:hypothetical protein
MNFFKNFIITYEIYFNLGSKIKSYQIMSNKFRENIEKII